MTPLASKPAVALAVSFVVMSALGIGFLFLYWAGRDLAQGGIRSILFVVVMGCVHLAGYLLYVEQTPRETRPTPRRRASFEFSPSYWTALKGGLVAQAACGVLTALLLDGGRTFGFFRVALIAHWIGIVLIMGFRPISPTRTDLLFIRFGVVLLTILTGVLAPIVWSFIGESPLSGLERLWGDRP